MQKRHCRSFAAHRRQRGSSLIEVMVAVLIMGIGLLGIAAMQATALRNSQSALERSQAVIHTYAILDAMRANRDAALAGAYNLAMTCTAPATDGTLAQADLNRWITDVKSSLGGNAADTTSCGSVNCADSVCAVTVRWDEQRASDNSATGLIAGQSNRSVTTSARL